MARLRKPCLHFHYLEPRESFVIDEFRGFAKAQTRVSPRRYFRNRLFVLAASLLCGVPIVVGAQEMARTVPDSTVQPADIERRQEQVLEQQRARAEQHPDVLSPATVGSDRPLSLPAETPCFQLNTFIWEGEPPPASLLRATQGVKGHCIGARGLRVLHAYLMEQLVHDGLITSRVLIPEQSLAAGELVLRFMPGRIAAVRSEEAVGWWRTAFPGGAGAMLDQQDLDQALENIRRLRGQADATIDVVPGAELGQSDLVIHPGSGKRWHAYVGGDNAGLDETGKKQLNAGLTLDSPLFLYDQLSLAWNSNARWYDSSANTQTAAVNYSVPVGYWTVFAGASRSRYRYQLSGFAVPVFYSGTSNQMQVGLSVVPYRGTNYKGSVSLALSRRRNANAVNDHDIDLQRRDVTNYDFQISHRHYLNRAVLDVGGGVRGTLPKFSRKPGVAHGAHRGHGRSTILSANFGAYVPFNVFDQFLSYRVNGHLQHAKTPIIASDYFTIGNRYAVRGFDGQMTLAAENGWTWRNDLALHLDRLLGVAGQELYAGLDVGRVGGASATYLSGRTLAGGVVGLRGKVTSPLCIANYDLSAGCPLFKPAALKTGKPVVMASVVFEF